MEPRRSQISVGLFCSGVVLAAPVFLELTLFISNLPEIRKFLLPLHSLILETNNEIEIMGGFFGTVAKATSCVADLFYGTDYNSHLGTKRGGLATYDEETTLFTRSIHNLEST